MGVKALIDMERKGCESIIHDHDCDLWVTMVGWVDVPYSDWGDFRRRRVVDISSCHWTLLTLNFKVKYDFKKSNFQVLPYWKYITTI